MVWFCFHTFDMLFLYPLTCIIINRFLAPFTAMNLLRQYYYFEIFSFFLLFWSSYDIIRDICFFFLCGMLEVYNMNWVCGLMYFISIAEYSVSSSSCPVLICFPFRTWTKNIRAFLYKYLFYVHFLPFFVFKYRHTICYRELYSWNTAVSSHGQMFNL